MKCIHKDDVDLPTCISHVHVCNQLWNSLLFFKGFQDLDFIISDFLLKLSALCCQIYIQCFIKKFMFLYECIKFEQDIYHVYWSNSIPLHLSLTCLMSIGTWGCQLLADLGLDRNQKPLSGNDGMIYNGRKCQCSGSEISQLKFPMPFQNVVYLLGVSRYGWVTIRYVSRYGGHDTIRITIHYDMLKHIVFCPSALLNLWPLHFQVYSYKVHYKWLLKYKGKCKSSGLKQAQNILCP